jgi:hypothetical protein
MKKAITCAEAHLIAFLEFFLFVGSFFARRAKKEVQYRAAAGENLIRCTIDPSNRETQS